jgi:hypothetical protein
MEKNVKGPDAAKTQRKPDMGVWGEARDARGRQHEIRIVTLAQAGNIDAFPGRGAK